MNWLSANLGPVVTSVLGVLGLLLLYYDRRMRFRLLKLDRVDRHELQEAELKLKREQFEAQTKERQERLNWLQRETLRLQEVGGELADGIARSLKKDWTWAAEVLEKASLGPHSETLFGLRRADFAEEKAFIARNFLPLLLQRCRHFVEKENKDVVLLVDSGTTIYPFFELLGKAFIRAHENRESWVERVQLLTNNLPGITDLIDKGRLEPNNRYSPLAIRCELIPGTPLPVYSAVTGEPAIARLEAKRNDEEGAVFIGLVAGNWVRLAGSDPVYPVPLARGPGHLDFKEALVANSDEIYVVTPLGKVFVKAEPDQINIALRLKDSNEDPDRQPYAGVRVRPENISRMRIVSTSRPQGFVLSHLSVLLLDHLSAREWDGDIEVFASQEMGLPGHVVFPYSKLPENPALQVEMEFPHAETRRGDFMERYFYVKQLSGLV